MLCKDILSSNKGKIIYDVKCTDSLPRLIKDYGGTPLMYPTGHFNIKNGIKEHNPLLAGEMSGHIFFNDRWYGFDDGVYSGARIIELIFKTKKSISNLNKQLPALFSTPELNIKVSDEKTLSFPLYAGKEVKKQSFVKRIGSTIDFIIWGSVK